jgi:hypothetical protein
LPSATAAAGLLSVRPLFAAPIARRRHTRPAQGHPLLHSESHVLT